MKFILEVRAAEGGDDSKLFANDLLNAYLRLADINSWKTTRL